MSFGGNGHTAAKTARPFEGLLPQLQRLYEQTESEFTRSRIRAFMNRALCSVCHGARLKPEILAVTISEQGGRTANIHQILRAYDRGGRAIR
jgi:excinuclease ABC subunit A